MPLSPQLYAPARPLLTTTYWSSGWLYSYLVTLIPDACATYSDAREAASLAAVAGYCRQRSTAEVLDELAQLTSQRKYGI